MSVLTRETSALPAKSSLEALVESTIQRSGQIATLPLIAVQIIRLTEDPNANIEDLKEVIANDPALGVRILKLVNSAYYGMPGEVDSLNRALLLLGLKAVKNIAIAASLVRMFRGGQVNAQFSVGDLWTHSIAVATAARMLATRSRIVLTDEAYLAGLIHDVGIVVEMQACGSQFAQLLERLETNTNLKFRVAEEQALGASHEAIGEGLCKAWNFPASLQRVTGYHHRPWELPEELRGLTTLIHLADVLVARIGLGYTRTVETDSLDPQLVSSLNLTLTDLDEVAQQLPAIAQESHQSLSEGK